LDPVSAHFPVAEGLSNKEIGARLGFSELAAFQVSDILQKLGTASRTEGVVKAKERGIIP
jgi:DNA-binding NarL/FixJ family response regulator